MNINITYSQELIEKVKRWFMSTPWFLLVIILSVELSIAATLYALLNDIIISYGDAESHLNISKRVMHSLTPGIAQLGGIWLPLPHLLMAPFVWIDVLWRTGLAGSIISGISFVISAIYLYKFTYILTHNRLTSFIASLIFMTNPNILYMQATPMTELPLIAFFILSTYYFTVFIKDQQNFTALILAGLFGFCATLSRYDGWFLVLFESAIIAAIHVLNKKRWKEGEGKIILFSTVAFFGIGLWMMWDYLILGDPFYFTTSQFSAKSQQQGWLAKGQLPAYHNIGLSFLYYFLTSMSNAGVIVFALAIIGFVLYIRNKAEINRFFILTVLFVPFVFYVFTLYVGQSLIFIPSLTPTTFEWTLFNTRYGLMMVPTVAFLVAYVFHKSKATARVLIMFLLIFQVALYGIGYSKVISMSDGVEGLSQSKKDYVEEWMTKNYDGGLVLIDDYKRIISLIRMRIPMQNVIYVGNRPYWEISLAQPQRYAQWIIMQKGDIVWTTMYDDPIRQADLYKYYEKTYTSPYILVFKRNSQFVSSSN